MTNSEFCRRLATACALPPGAHVLAAVSGGADSTALLCFLCDARESMGLTVSCAHVEHGIRGAASQEDYAFVQALCGKKGVAFYGAHVDAPALAAQLGCGLEDAARRLRRRFLLETAERIGADAVALAHHAGDQAETVLLHAARGSDVRGLCAMRARQGRIIRPLLDATAQELRESLRSRGQAWREDATNGDMAYARNRVRLAVLPELECACPGAGAALVRLARAAQRDEAHFSRLLDARGLAVLPLCDGAALERALLEGLDDALLSRALVRLLDGAGVPVSTRALERMTTLARGETGAAVSLEGRAQARLGARYLCVTREDAVIPDTPLSPEGETHTPFGVFAVRDALPGETGDGRLTQAIPAARLAGARVTARREGDAMIPFGRHSPVSLRRLMIDAGVERAMRNSVPLLRQGESILWAVGMRPGEGCRAADTAHIRLLTFRGEWPQAAGTALDKGKRPLHTGDEEETIL